MQIFNRREFLGVAGGALSLTARPLPAAPVAIAPVKSYEEDLAPVLARMFDQIGGLPAIVRNKTVTIKLNMTGSPALRIGGRPLGVTHYNHEKVLEAALYLMDRAGAKRIRLVESFWASRSPLEENMMDSGWSPRKFLRITDKVEFENTNNLGSGKNYVRFPVPGGGLLFPAYDLSRAYAETDVMVSLAKLKEHATCGVTLGMKNMFGITPAAIYGDDAGETEPNENPTKGRVNAMHLGKRQPAKSAPSELDPDSPRDPGFRMPRVTAELIAARPTHLTIIDGIESIAGGEGPWIAGVRVVKPGVLIVGTNPVSTDAVGTAVMGFDPRAPRGTAPFEDCDNTLLLAEQLGLGTADLNNIEVVGSRIAEVRIPFRRAGL